MIKSAENTREEHFAVVAFKKLMRRATNIFHGGNQSQESEYKTAVTYKVIDETSSANPFCNNPAIPDPFIQRPKDWFFEGSLGPEGSEGFFHNPEAHRHVGKMLSQLFELRPDSKVLEFGCGQNYEVARGLLDSGCNNVTLLDYNHSSGNRTITEDHSPANTGEHVHGSIPIYSGDFAYALAEGSDLKSTAGTFDLIMINGALFSLGYNFTAAHLAEAEYHSKPNSDHDDRQEIGRYIDNYISGVIDTAKNLLKTGGTFFFSSSRYANHGAGYPELYLHKEKLEFLKLIHQLKLKGAKKITVFGVSSAGIRNSIDFNLASQNKQKLIFIKLFVETFEAPFPLEVVQNGKRRALNKTELSQIANNPDQLAPVLGLPQVKAVVDGKLKNLEERLSNVASFLTSAVSDLPEGLDEFSTDQASVHSIKIDMKDFPGEIARIDAVGAQF